MTTGRELPGAVEPGPPCSAAARERDDPLAGTAAPAQRWLLVEHWGPWAPAALASPGVAPAAAALTAAVRATSGRVLLIRRPGRQVPREARLWAVADPGAGLRWGEWRDAEGLRVAAAALRDPGPASGPQDPLLLVCAHGTRDVCCAVRGRPVAQALEQRWPGQTWECSHLGGDRFAANLLVLPDGACYGRLDGDTAADVVEAHLEGRTAPGHLRGPSTEPPVVQAAIVAALREWGPARVGDLRGVGTALVGPDRWQVRLAGRGALPPFIEATVSRRRSTPQLMTCRAAAPDAVYTYEVGTLRTLAAGVVGAD